jgi:hypothetical protein
MKSLLIYPLQRGDDMEALLFKRVMMWKPPFSKPVLSEVEGADLGGCKQRTKSDRCNKIQFDGGGRISSENEKN